MDNGPKVLTPRCDKACVWSTKCQKSQRVTSEVGLILEHKTVVRCARVSRIESGKCKGNVGLLFKHSQPVQIPDLTTVFAGFSQTHGTCWLSYQLIIFKADLMH